MLLLYLPCLGNTVLQPLCNTTVNSAAKGMLTSAWVQTAGAFAGVEMSFLNPRLPLKTEGSRKMANRRETRYQKLDGSERAFPNLFPATAVLNH